MWLNIEQAAEYANVHRNTMSKWLQGGLKHSRLSPKVVRIKEANIDAFLEQYEQDGCGVNLDKLLEDFR